MEQLLNDIRYNGPEVIAVVCLNLLGMFVQAVSGFGESVIVQAGWHVLEIFGLSSGKLSESDFILTVITLPLMGSQAILQRRYLNTRLALTAIFSQVVGTAIGVNLLFVCNEHGLKGVLGVMLLFVAVWSMLQETGILQQKAPGTSVPPANAEDHYHKLPAGLPVKEAGNAVCEELLASAGNQLYDPFASPSRFILICIVGISSGVLGGLFATPGPPNMVFVLFAGIPKNEWRATGAASNVGCLMARFAILMLHSGSAYPSAFLWLECALSFLGGMLGLLLGNMLAARVSEKAFRGFIICFLVAGGISMLH